MATTAPTPRSLTLLAAILGFACGAGCMTKQQAASMRTGQGEAMPVIDVQPGVAARLAWMDAYRLHDETRKHMMRRPHVTIEEIEDVVEVETEEPEAAEVR